MDHGVPGSRYPPYFFVFFIKVAIMEVEVKLKEGVKVNK
jgi:hypothetical protein